MKKNLLLLTGIVFLTTILIAGSCKPVVQPPEEGPKKVKIHLKVVKEDGDKHLKMYDSNKPGTKAVDALETLVMPGDTVVWEPTILLSRIKNIEKIGTETKGNIITMDAEPVPGTRNFRLIIPENAPIPSEREKYEIKFKDRKGRTWTIDPYLRIPNIE